MATSGPWDPSWELFERFTQQARRVVVFATEEAHGLRHSCIGTEHLLLGLLREEEGLAARALQALDITVDRTRAEVVRLVPPGDVAARDSAGQVPLTRRAKKVLERSLRETLNLGHHHIGTEHILLALVRDNDGVAVRILLGLDVAPEKIRDELLRILPDWSPQAPGPGPVAARGIGDVVPWHPTDQSWFGELGAHINGLAWRFGAS